MAELKMVEEYNAKYGDIPKDKNQRLDYLVKKLSSKRALGPIFESEVNRIRNIKWKKLSFVIYLVPKGTPRPRMGRGAHFYVKGASDNKKFFKSFYKDLTSHPMIVTGCKITCISYLPLSSSMKRYEMVLAEMGLIRPLVTPDCDNLIKTYMDMIQGTLLGNDSFVIECTSKKYYSAKPRVEISISYMEEFDSEFNKKKVKGVLKE